MNFKKLPKGKAPIYYKTIIDEFNSHFKYSGKSIFLSNSQPSGNIQKRSYESHNMKIMEIKCANVIKQNNVSNNKQYNNDIYLFNTFDKNLNYNKENKANGDNSNIYDLFNSKKNNEDNCYNNTKIRMINEKENKFDNNIISYNKKLNRNLFYGSENESNNSMYEKEGKYDIFEKIQGFITFQKKNKKLDVLNINNFNRNDNRIIDNNIIKAKKAGDSNNLLLSLNHHEKLSNNHYITTYESNSNNYTNVNDSIDIQNTLKYTNDQNNNFTIDNTYNENNINSGNFSYENFFLKSDNKISLYKNDKNFVLNNNKFINKFNNYKNKDNVQNIINELYKINEKKILKLNNENINENRNNNINDNYNNDLIKIKDNINEENNFNYNKYDNDINEVEMKEENKSCSEKNYKNDIKLKKMKIESDIEIDSSNEDDKSLKGVDTEIKNNTIKGSESEETLPSQNILYFLPCREKEQEEIYNYIKKGLYTQGSYSSLYISGMPGTGKTESVNRVIDILQNQTKKDSNNINKLFQIIYINGIEYSNPKNVFKTIYEKLFIKKSNTKSIIKSLDNFFMYRNNYDSSIYLKNPNNCHIILILDEVDLLIDKSQFLLYNIFNWTTYPNSRFIVISISNTLDLPNKLLPKVKSRMGNNKLLFNPYTKDELYKIIINQGINIKNYDEDALKLSSVKVAAVNGDLRRIIKILNKSKEIFEEEKRDFPKSSNNNIINKFHVLKACSELFDSKLIQVLKALKDSEKIILASLLQNINDNDENRINVCEIFSKKDRFLKKYNENFPFELDISWDEYQRIIYNLCRLKIISFYEEKKQNFIDNFIVIKFYTDEFMAACEKDETMKPLLELLII